MTFHVRRSAVNNTFILGGKRRSELVMGRYGLKGLAAQFFNYTRIGIESFSQLVGQSYMQSYVCFRFRRTIDVFPQGLVSGHPYAFCGMYLFHC